MQNTLRRSIRLYPHEWLEIDRMCKTLTRYLRDDVKADITPSRLLAFVAADAQSIDPMDVHEHTIAARVRDAKRRARR